MSNTDTLTETLSDTLALFTGAAEYSAAGILDKLPDDVNTSAVNNRLERLRSMGLLSRRRVGHEWHYRRARNGSAPRSPKVRG